MPLTAPATTVTAPSPFHDAPDASLLAQRVHHYELLSRMGYWSHKLSDYAFRRLPPVYSRDFAYDDNAPILVRMARSNIGDLSAKEFAEYAT